MVAIARVTPQVNNAWKFQPTDAAPGSKEKLRVMSERLELGLPLNHPDDAKVDCVGDTSYVARIFRMAM